MKRVHYKRTRIIDAPPEVVACLWTNWEIYDALLGGKFNIRRTGNSSWRGRYFVSADINLVSREAGLDVGKFVYTFNTNVSGFPGATVVTLRYTASLSGETSVEGVFENELNWLYGITEPLVRRRITRAVDAVIEGGQVSCERISKNYKQVRQDLPQEYLDVIDSYLDTAKRVRAQPYDNPLLQPATTSSIAKAFKIQRKKLQLMADEVGSLVFEINQMNQLLNGSDVFVSSNQSWKIYQDLKTAAVSEVSFAAFAQAAYRLVFDSTTGLRNGRSRPLERLPEDFRRSKQIVRVIDTLRHHFGGAHLTDLPTFNAGGGGMPVQDVLKIYLHKPGMPRDDQFLALQFAVLADLIAYLGEIRSFLSSE